MSTGVLSWSMTETVTGDRYHLGTAAFGSLVIAVVMFIRSVVLYIQKQVEKNNNSSVRATG